MFSKDLESRFRGMFAKVKIAEDTVEDITRAQNQPVPQEHASDADEADEDTSEDATPVSPEQHQNIRRRAIVREWPRDPDGPVMVVTPPGKIAGNKQLLWGATVLDFYFVRRGPKFPYGRTISTGSKLSAWMKMIGELKHAKDEIAWAEEEAEPEELFPCDVAMLIRDMDYRSHGIRSFFNDNFRMADDRISSQLYPKFQTRLPFHLLPEKLIVHDPDDTLRVGSGEPRSAEERHIPRLYKLQLIQETIDGNAKEREKLDQASTDKPRAGKVYMTASEEISTGQVKEGSVSEPIFAMYPPAPSTPLSTPKAHLYINASEALGTGNHSQVYRVAWDIPRSLVMEPYVCPACSEQAFVKALREEAPEVEVNEFEPLGDQIEALLLAVAAKNGRQGKMSVEETTKLGLRLDLEGDIDGPTEVVFEEPKRIIDTTYEGPTRAIPIDVKWTTPGNFCEHEKIRNRAPTMFKVSIAAKLSLEDDKHLEREASNYQKFPGHFFQHWSGYNVVPPIHDPTPALAIVPQFYGYYVPDDSEVKDGQYLSPIMLLEDCGVPIEADDLDLDDRHECAALLFRMHAGGWLHNSFYPRNVVMQHGNMTEWPVGRKVEDRRFRLIDFGRSEYGLTGEPLKTFPLRRAGEEYECQKMFKILNASDFYGLDFKS